MKSLPASICTVVSVVCIMYSVTKTMEENDDGEILDSQIVSEHWALH